MVTQQFPFHTLVACWGRFSRAYLNRVWVRRGPSAYRVQNRRSQKVIIMEVLMALILIGPAGFVTYLALDAARHAK